MIWLSKNWLTVAAAISSIVTLALASFDKTSSAIVAAGFTLALVVLQNFPILESLEGWGVKAKIRAEKVEKDLHKAEELLKQIDNIAATVSSVSLSWMYYVGRLDGPSWRERAIIAQKIRGLYGKGSAPTHIEEAFARTIDHQIHLMTAYFLHAINLRCKLLNIDETLEVGEILSYRDEKDFRKIVSGFVDQSKLPESEKAKIRRYIPTVVSNYAKIHDFDETADKIEYDDVGKVYAEIFGEPLQQ